MTQEHFSAAIDIIARHHSTQVNINAAAKHFIGDIGSTVFLMYITRCVPALIKDMVEHGYLLSMTDSGLLVDKI